MPYLGRIETKTRWAQYEPSAPVVCNSIRMIEKLFQIETHQKTTRNTRRWARDHEPDCQSIQRKRDLPPPLPAQINMAGSSWPAVMSSGLIISWLSIRLSRSRSIIGFIVSGSSFLSFTFNTSNKWCLRYRPCPCYYVCCLSPLSLVSRSDGAQEETSRSESEWCSSISGIGNAAKQQAR